MVDIVRERARSFEGDDTVHPLRDRHVEAGERHRGDDDAGLGGRHAARAEERREEGEELP